MPNVFVVQENPRIDISPAMKFGKIITILPPGDTNFSYEYISEKIKRTIEKEAQPGDYLLLTGDPVSIGLASIAMYAMLGDLVTLKFLKWLPRELKYIEIAIDPKWLYPYWDE